MPVHQYCYTIILSDFVADPTLGLDYMIYSPDFLACNGMLYYGGWRTEADVGPDQLYQSPGVSTDAPTSIVWNNGAPYDLWHVNDPSVVQEANGTLAMFATALSNQYSYDAFGMGSYNLVCLSTSTNNGASWTWDGIVIGQYNGIYNTGAWSPSALTAGNYIDLWYNTAWSDAVTGQVTPGGVMLSVMDSTGATRLSTEACINTATGQPLVAANVDVMQAADGTYWMVCNDYSSASDLYKLDAYESQDGISWTPWSTSGATLLSAGTRMLLTPTILSVGDGSLNIMYSEKIGDNTIEHTADFSLSDTNFTSSVVSDFLFQNQSGQMAQWTVSGSSISTGADIGINPGPAWFAMGTGAFYTGDTSDIVWQNTNGEVAVWQVQGTSMLGGGIIAVNPGTAWHIKGTGDFYNDGNTDILWQNDNGEVALWDMQGSNIVGGAVLAADPGPTWHIEGTGDFYGDGNTDILWQNDNGSVAIWDMNGTSIVQGAVIAVNPGSTWHIKGTGDFYGDGLTDILWQNDNGGVALWEMQGSTIVQGGIVAVNPGPTWHIEAVGDFNNDAGADIAWQNDNGSVAVWDMNGATIAAGAVLLNPSTSWSVLGGDQNMRFIYSGAAGESLAAIPVAPEEFVFTSVAAGAHTITGFNVTQDVVELSSALVGSFAAVQAATTAAAGGALIHLGASSTLYLAGVNPGSLHASDFALG